MKSSVPCPRGCGDAPRFLGVAPRRIDFKCEECGEEINMPPATRPTRTTATRPAAADRFKIAGGTGTARGERIVIYGEGGIGKSSLAALAPDPVFADLEDGTSKLDVQRVGGIATLQDLRDALHEPSLWAPYRTIVIDSGTALQELAIAHTLATVKHEKNKPVSSIEDYGWGKGYQYVYDTFLLILGDFDQHIRAGRNIVLLCHLAVERAPNPDGDDFLRYEPSLQQPPKQGRIRDRVRDWCDHLLFIQYDKKVTEGKAVGGGTRTIYPTARPTYWAKSRSLRDPIVFEDPVTNPEGAAELWNQLGLN